jgi:hypothetical protein
MAHTSPLPNGRGSGFDMISGQNRARKQAEDDVTIVEKVDELKKLRLKP